MVESVPPQALKRNNVAKSYSSYIDDYATLKSIVYERTHVSATAEQMEKAGHFPQTSLERRIRAEESRKITTMVEQQEEEFLKVAMKPSDMNMDFRVAGTADSIRSKRSSIFNLPLDHDEDIRVSSLDSLQELPLSSRKGRQQQNSPSSPPLIKRLPPETKPPPDRHFSQTYEGSLAKREASVERMDMAGAKPETDSPRPSVDGANWREIGNKTCFRLFDPSFQSVKGLTNILAEWRDSLRIVRGHPPRLTDHIILKLHQHVNTWNSISKRNLPIDNNGNK